MDSKMTTNKDVEATASNEQLGTVVNDPNGALHRALKERHVQFIAVGGTIGTGLLLGIGSALATSAPLSLWLGYSVTAAAIWCMVSLRDAALLIDVLLQSHEQMQCLGEMASLLPLPGMIAQMGSRFVDPAFGFAIGWNQWYNCAIAICAETSAAVVLIRFWTDINVSAANIRWKEQ